MEEFGAYSINVTSLYVVLIVFDSSLLAVSTHLLHLAYRPSSGKTLQTHETL